MGKTEEDWNGLKLGFLIFLRLIPADCSFKNNVRETYLFVSDLWFCHLHLCNFFAYFKFYSDWGRVIGKIKQNELDCRDTAPLNHLAFQMCTFHLSDYFLFSVPPVSYFLEFIIDCLQNEQSLFDRAWKMRQTCARTVRSGRLSRYVMRGKGREENKLFSWKKRLLHRLIISAYKLDATSFFIG